MPAAPGPLQFGSRTTEPAPRTLEEMREVLLDPSFLHYADLKRPVYFMYRGLFLSERDGALLKERRLRYDITVIPPGTLGPEFAKTLGHYHPPAPEPDRSKGIADSRDRAPEVPGGGMTYPELYEVLEGEAHYLLQTVAGGVTASDPPGTAAPGGVAPQTLPSTGPPPLPGRIKDVVLVRAKAGDKVLIPPGYGHVTINPSRKVLRMANLVADGFHSLYEPYRRAGGAAYYETSDGKFAPNPRPAPPPPLREAKPAREVARGGEIYGWLRKAPDELAFLTEPRKFGDLWGRVLR